MPLALAAALADLIHDLQEFRALPQAAAEPVVEEASLAVTRAALSVRRGLNATRAAETEALAEAEEAVIAARVALERAKASVVALASVREAAGASRERLRQARVRTATAHRALRGILAGALDLACPRCAERFQLRYWAEAEEPRTVGMIDCPRPGCRAQVRCSWPATAIELVVSAD